MKQEQDKNTRERKRAKFTQRAGQTIVMVTHNRKAAGYAQRIVRLRDGAIEQPE